MTPARAPLVAVLALTLLLVGCANGSGAAAPAATRPASAPVASPPGVPVSSAPPLAPSSATATPAACAPGDVAPFSCGPYLVVSGSRPGSSSAWLRERPLRAEFERLNGEVTLVVVGPVNAYDVPIRTTADGGRSDGASGTLEGRTSTAPGSDCDHDAWLARLLSGPASYRADGDTVTVTGAGGTLLLRTAATR